MKVYDYRTEEAYALIRSMMLSEEPQWLSRYGGSDTNFVNFWEGDPSEPCVALMKKLNGYYDKDNLIANLHRFRSMYVSSMRHSDLCFVHISSDAGTVFKGDVEARLRLKQKFNLQMCMDWTFIEQATYFLKSFSEWGGGLTVLVVSPFSESIRFQTSPDRIGLLHRDPYTLPDTRFVCVNSPITYNDSEVLCEETNAQNWFDTAENIFQEVSKHDFDVAFLSCGSYAMYLGDRIKSVLGKKSIYIGGMLNVIFALYGDRYSKEVSPNKSHDRDCGVNVDYRITPLENSRYIAPHSDVSTYPLSEGLRAYFNTEDI